MTWSQQQELGLKAVADWFYAKQSPQVFRLFGYAGTGKTTLAKEIAGTIKGKVVFGAFTGKAALVMQSKGCVGAATIHSLIYSAETDEKTGLAEFKLNPASPVGNAKLVIIDECSMVDESLGHDLLSFDTKVLVLGDPAQLPPVKGAGFFTAHEPDIMLSEIHRQARDNPIIDLATTARERKPIQRGVYGLSKVIDWPSENEVLNADQVLVGRNITRRRHNEKIRSLKGLQGNSPVPNDKLVCLRNRRERGLLNGGLWSVEKILDSTVAQIRMIVAPVEAGGTVTPVEVSVHPYFFLGRENEIDPIKRRDYDEFDFGYCLTVHKSQGSQWDSVVLFDESGAFREDRYRWLYTAITRAAERVVIVQ